MASVSPFPQDQATKTLQTILRRIGRMSVAELGTAIQKDESTACRVRSGEAKLSLEECARLIAAIGCKLVDQNKRCVDPEIYEALVHINMRAMRNEQTVRTLLTDDDPE